MEAIDSDGTEGFGHVVEICSGEPLFAETPVYSFNQASQLQGCAISGSEPKLLVSHQSAFLYNMQDHS